MSTHPSKDPTRVTAKATVYTQHPLQREESTHGQSNPTVASMSYPVPEADYQQVAQNADVFFEKLQSFHRSLATKFKVPTIGGRALDLHRLFVEVTSRGGIEKVVRDRKWKEVIAVFNFPSTITSASFVLRKYYQSLLYHFEQVYYFRKEVASVPITDDVSRIPVNGSAALRVIEDGAAANQLPGSPTLEPGSLVTGTIDAKFDNGYLITVDLGSEKLQGVLYHPPTSMSHSSNTTTAVHGNRKRYQLALRDPSRPKPNRSGYNFFFAEHYTTLKPLYHGQEKAISKKIGLLWSRLTEAERQVYQEKGLKDKERYRTEMLE